MKRMILALVLAAGLHAAEEKTTEHKTFSGVRELVIDNITGFIEVTTSTGGSVEMDIEKTLSGESADRLSLAKKEISLSTTQEGGLVRLLVDGPFRCHCSENSINFRGYEVYKFSYDFKVRVPRDVKLELRTVNHSHISLEGTAGDYTISNVNGPIDMKDVEGSGTVHTVNGGVKVLYARNPTGATSFESVNGSLDVSFRAGLNADVRMKTMNGGLYTDFEVTALPVATALTPENRNGKLVWSSSRTMTGVRIGHGGPELTFETLNGNVMVRNREK
jgi:DUF4097 and DUF4098 domain-containing protein YvlB